jgi:phosphoglycolate phosphatase
LQIITDSGIIKGIWPELEDKVEEMFTSYTPPKHYLPKVKKETVDVFEALNNKGFTLGVLSSGMARSVRRSYKKFVDENFKYHLFVYTQEDTVPYHKPDARVFDKALKELKGLGIRKKEALYVGDHIFDLKAAENAGMDFIAVTTGVNSKNDFLDAGMDEDLILDSFLDIEKVL